MAKIKNNKSVDFYSKKFLYKHLKKFISSKENFHRINIHKSENDIVHIMLMFYKKNSNTRHIILEIKLSLFQL